MYGIAYCLSGDKISLDGEGRVGTGGGKGSNSTAACAANATRPGAGGSRGRKSSRRSSSRLKGGKKNKQVGGEAHKIRKEEEEPHIQKERLSAESCRRGRKELMVNSVGGVDLSWVALTQAKQGVNGHGDD